MIGEPFPLLAWLPSIERNGNGSAGRPPTRSARGNSLSPAGRLPPGHQSARASLGSFGRDIDDDVASDLAALLRLVRFDDAHEGEPGADDVHQPAGRDEM